VGCYLFVYDMKKIFLFILAYFLLPSFGGVGGGCQSNITDAKRDFVWKMGTQGYARPIDSLVGSITMDFNTNPRAITVNSDSAGFAATCATICDTTGNLLFYTNNFFVYNKTGRQMAGSDTLTSDPHILTYGLAFGHIFIQTAMILPQPNHSNLYYILHQRVPNQYSPYTPAEFYYTVVDMSLDNGLGRIVSWRNRLDRADGVLGAGKLTACRHANGRDWWIIQWSPDQEFSYCFLLTPEGIINKGKRRANSAPLEVGYGYGQAQFSPDGIKYVAVTNESPLSSLMVRGRLDVYNFDRCEGVFSRRAAPIYLEAANIIGTDTVGLMLQGVAISPNSRYFYTSVNYLNPNLTILERYYQYDLDAPDIAASQQTIGIYDGFSDPMLSGAWPTMAWSYQLAPDGKIYISTGTTTHYLSTIDNPDIGGVGCNLRQHSVQLPALNFRTVPNHPHFRLGALAGSTCDSLTPTLSKGEGDRQSMALFPNPTTESTRLVWYENLGADANITITNSIGQVVQQIAVSKGSTYQDIDTKNLPNGIYYLSIYDNNSLVVGSSKFVVLHE
jgi:Secretion system C-terminal sorting domain